MRVGSARILLPLGSVAITLLVLECFARLAVPPASRENFVPVPGTIRMPATIPDVPYLLRPNGRAEHAYPSDPRGYFDPGPMLTYRTNALGFRGPETSRAKPPGKLRILGFGDSFTFGTGVRQEDTFLAVLERALNQASGEQRYQVLNLGVGGYNTVHEVSLLRHRGLALEPDLVLLCFFLNDAGGGPSTLALNAEDASRQRPFWRRHSRLLDHLAVRLARRSAVAGLVESYRASFEAEAPGWRRARRALRQAKRLADRQGFGLVLVIFPVLWNLSGDYPFAGIHQEIAAFAKAEGIPVLDLQPALSGFDGPELWVHPNDQHPNERAHALAGREIQRFLGQSGLLGGAPPSVTGRPTSSPSREP